MAEKDFPGLGKLSNKPPLGLRPRGGKNSSLPQPRKSIFPAITVIAIMDLWTPKRLLKYPWPLENKIQQFHYCHKITPAKYMGLLVKKNLKEIGRPLGRKKLGGH